MALDATPDLIDQIKAAGQGNRKLLIQGHSSKRGWLASSRGDDVLDLTSHQGVLQYQPEELVITARAGTPLALIEETLADCGQMLASEPPCLGANTSGAGTLGGAVSSGLSGPGRPWLGAIRDAVLGVELINGAGEYLRFGGQVMKNVAGYDVSRLQAGAWGCLGVMSVISLRVQPLAEQEWTLSGAMAADAAIDLCADLGRRNLPINGNCWYQGVLYLRLSGNASGVAAACESLSASGLSRTDETPDLWRQLKNHEHRYFHRGAAPKDESKAEPSVGSRAKLWRVITPPAAPLPSFLNAPETDLLTLWNGGLRWLYHDQDDAVRAYSHAVGGWCWALGEVMPMEAAQRRVIEHLMAAFDSSGVFANPLGLAPKAVSLSGGVS
ncbi:MAG: glycolate oxidase subunit GlcE [Gammaproteobacteria bacterium]